MELMERRRILLNTPHINIVTGLQFVTDMVAPLESLVISFSPIQDINGYDNPWPAGGGKNLFNPQKLIDAGATYTNGKYEATQTIIQSISLNDITFKENTQYYFYVHGAINSPSSSGAMRVKLTYTDSTTSYVNILSGEGERDLDGYSTSGKTIQSAEFSAYGTLGTYTNWISKFMICEASDGTEYAPYSNVCPITGWTGMNVTRTGKNLFNKNTAEIGKWLDVDTGVEASTSTGYALSDYIPVNAGITYTMTNPYSSRRWLYDANKNPLSKIDSLTFTPTVDGYARITIALNSTSIDQVQIELGSTATSYEAYTGETYSIDWTDEAGTVYGGSLDVTTGVLTVTHSVLDMGTVEWSLTGNRARYTLSGVYVPDKSVVPDAIAEQYTAVNANTSLTAGQFAVSTGGVIILYYDGETAPDGLLVYPLATPITYQLTPQQIRTVKGTNNLFSNSNGEVTINYWTHLD